MRKKEITNLSDIISQNNKKVIKSEPTKINDILIGAELSRYGNISKKEYTAQLNDYSLQELKSHAKSIGINADGDKEKCINRLLKEFDTYWSVYNKPKYTDANLKLKENKLKELKKIMSFAK